MGSLIVLGIIIVIGLWLMLAYNGLVSLRQRRR